LGAAAERQAHSIPGAAPFTLPFDRGSLDVVPVQSRFEAIRDAIHGTLADSERNRLPGDDARPTRDSCRSTRSTRFMQPLFRRLDPPYGRVDPDNGVW
jgi:hypothetical protein